MACITPYYVKNPQYGKLTLEKMIPVPCGRCPECIERRTNQWILRLTEEMKTMNPALFLTLTYSTETVPITKNGFMTLDKTDLQKFFKRLRKHHPTTIKYYGVGEYGTNKKRPHYHVIILGTYPQFIQKSWNLGDIHIGTVSSSSIAYCCKYIAKDSLLTRKTKHGRDDRQIEFSLMSKKLGLNYIKKRSDWHHADINRNYAIVEDGIKIPLPRYYREKIYDEPTRLRQNMVAKALSHEQTTKQYVEYMLKYPDHTYDDFERSIEQSTEHKLKTYNKNASRNRS